MSEHDDSGPLPFSGQTIRGCWPWRSPCWKTPTSSSSSRVRPSVACIPEGATGPYGVPEIRVAAQNADEGRETY